MKKITKYSLLGLGAAGSVLSMNGLSADADSVVKVQRGDTLFGIANEHSTTVDKLVADNHIENRNLIFVGQDIKVIDEKVDQINTGNQNVAVEKLIQAAEGFIGVPYVWGGASSSGVDCSGLIQQALLQASLPSIGRTTYTQSATLRLQGQQPKNMSQAKRGDLLFWGGVGSEYHVALYLGGGQMIVAPVPGGHVEITNVWGQPQAYSMNLE